MILQQTEHGRFKRVGDSLKMTKTISLQEALCGCVFQVEHLDKRLLTVRCPPGQVIKPGIWNGIANRRAHLANMSAILDDVLTKITTTEERGGWPWKDRKREGERERDREIERETETDRDRQRQREREEEEKF